MTEAEITARMEIAHKEIDEHAPEYDHCEVNAEGKLDDTIEQIIGIIRKEGYDIGI